MDGWITHSILWSGYLQTVKAIVLFPMSGVTRFVPLELIGLFMNLIIPV